jgi:hypothetical protein
MRSTWADRFLLVSSLLLSAGVLIAWTSWAYLGIRVNELLAFVSADGACDLASTGLGIHCFNDYTRTIDVLIAGTMWSVPNPYTPVGSLLFWPFIWVQQATGSPRAGLLAFLACGLVCLLVPALWAAWHRRRLAGILVLMLGFAATPVLVALDRGNSVAFVVPALLLFAVAFARERWKLLLVAVVLASCVKPQFALLAIAFVPVRQIRMLVLTAGAVVVVNVAAIPFATGDPAGMVRQVLSGASGVSGRMPYGGIGGGNVSFAQSTLDVGQLLVGSTDAGWRFLSAINDMPSLVVLSLIAATLIAFILLRERLAPALVICWSLALASMVVTLSWAYYTVFAVVVAALLVVDPVSPDDESGRGLLDFTVGSGRAGARIERIASAAFAWILLLATALTVYQLPVGIAVFRSGGASPVSSVSRLLIAPSWVAVFAAGVAWALARGRKPA